ncbi:hypothetical protein ACH5RR_039393 [Cinchona calisaya]|uniref:Uncharacterized protein n=1 Tax=Cinchona calisaya TaxID=153742 RepID=A0ABD2Y0W0_9GENT
MDDKGTKFIDLNMDIEFGKDNFSSNREGFEEKGNDYAEFTSVLEGDGNDCGEFGSVFKRDGYYVGEFASIFEGDENDSREYASAVENVMTMTFESKDKLHGRAVMTHSMVLLEKHASQVYIRNVFYRVRKHLSRQDPLAAPALLHYRGSDGGQDRRIAVTNLALCLHILLMLISKLLVCYKFDIFLMIRSYHEGILLQGFGSLNFSIHFRPTNNQRIIGWQLETFQYIFL